MGYHNVAIVVEDGEDGEKEYQVVIVNGDTIVTHNEISLDKICGVKFDGYTIIGLKMKKEDKTKIALKSLFEGQTEEEIDQLVSELKLTLDEASEEAKGELDLGGTEVSGENSDSEPISWEWDASVPHKGIKPIKINGIPTGFDPVDGDKSWHERYKSIEKNIYDEYEIDRNLKSRNRKNKINRFLKKYKLSVFALSTDKEVKTYNRALSELFLRVNLMDEKSIALKDERVTKMRDKAKVEQLKMKPYAHEPVIYAKPV